MLSRIKELLEKELDFAFETTLTTKSYLRFIREARKKGYFISLVFFWLSSPDLAIERVKSRVSEGGHHIPEEVVVRRYYRGLKNLFTIFLDEVDYALIFDNSGPNSELIAEKDQDLIIRNFTKFELLKSLQNEH